YLLLKSIRGRLNMQGDKDEYIIQRSKENEEMMILIYAQWCINHDIVSHILYNKFYTDQTILSLLYDGMKSTVTNKESEEITEEMVIQLLKMYGNDDLAFAVQEKVDEKERS